MSADDLPDPAERGTLEIAPAVISKMAAHSITERSNSDTTPHVSVAAIDSKSVELTASLSLPYLDEPLAATLNRLRVDVAADVRGQTGRNVSRLDLRVDRLTLSPERPVRRVI